MNKLETIKYKVHVQKKNNTTINANENMYVDSNSFCPLDGKVINMKITFNVPAILKEIQLKLNHNIKIQGQLFNIANDKEIDRKDIDIAYFTSIQEEDNGMKQIYTWNSEETAPYEHLRIILQNNDDWKIKVYYLGLRGQNIRIEKKQQSEKKQSTLDQFTFKSTFLDNNGSYQNFIHCVSSGRDPAGRPQEQSGQKKQQQQGKINIKKDVVNKKEQQDIQLAKELSMQQQIREKYDKPNLKISEEDSISLMIIENDQFQQIQKTKQKEDFITSFATNDLGYGDQPQQFGLKSNYKQNKLGYSDELPKQQQQLNFISDKKNYNTQSQDQVILKYMEKYKSYEINQDFMQFHKQLELTAGKRQNQLLQNVMYQ